MDQSRINRVLAAFTLSRRAALQETTGLSVPVLSPTYRSARSEKVIATIADGVAQELGVQAKRVRAWLAGSDDQQIDLFLTELETLKECTRCHQFVPEENWVANLSQCRACARATANPRGAAWIKIIEALMPQVADDVLQRGWSAVQDDGGEAITDVRMSAAVGLPVKEWRRRWARAGLPRKHEVRCGGGGCKCPAHGGQTCGDNACACQNHAVAAFQTCGTSRLMPHVGRDHFRGVRRRRYRFSAATVKPLFAGLLIDRGRGGAPALRSAS